MPVYRIGCAGWSYRDWVGQVYPPRLPTSRWLEAYASLFPIVEIDATFYGLPSPQTVAGWVDRARRIPGFTFAAKLTQDATHTHLPRGRLDEARRVAREFLARVVEPLEGAGRLEAVLVQLPPGFGLVDGGGGQEPVSLLTGLLEALEPKRRRVAVEFRNASWFEHVGERLVPEAVEALTGLLAAAVQVDGLGFRIAQTRTAPWSYFRFHGRRAHIPPAERGLSHAPYNYLYPESEVGELASLIAPHAALDDRTIVVFNNHYKGQAARNAMDLMGVLGMGRPKPAVTLSREAKLDEFAG